MKQAKSFGVRGMTAEERAAVNPYMAKKVPLGGYAGSISARGIDENLRAFMLGVYGYMFIGLLLTGLAAFFTHYLTVTTNPAFAAVNAQGLMAQVTDTEYLTNLGVWLWTTEISYLVCFGPLLLLIFAAPVFRGINPTAATVVFMLVATLIGVSFSGLALSYTNASMTRVFFVTAAAFGGLSLIGYTTKKDLSGWGSFLWMGFFGLLAAIVINWFLQSNALEFAFSAIGVIVFAGFTVYDTQMIKEAYSDRMTGDESKSLAISGALDLYLDFVNLFRFLLYFLGERE